MAGAPVALQAFGWHLEAAVRANGLHYKGNPGRCCGTVQMPHACQVRPTVLSFGVMRSVREAWGEKVQHMCKMRCSRSMMYFAHAVLTAKVQPIQ